MNCLNNYASLYSFYFLHRDLSFIIFLLYIDSLCVCSVQVYFLFSTLVLKNATIGARHARPLQTRPINSANPAISEINNKIPNESKSAVIEAFLCGRCRAIVRPAMHDLIIEQRRSRIACQLTGTPKFD